MGYARGIVVLELAAADSAGLASALAIHRRRFVGEWEWDRG